MNAWLHAFARNPANDVWLAAVVANWTPAWAYRKAWRWAQIAAQAVVFQAALAACAWRRLREVDAEAWVLVLMLALFLFLVGVMAWGIYESFQPQCTVVVTNTSGHAGHFGLWRCPNSWGFGGGWDR